MDPITIREGATVYDANGDKLGKVHAVEADRFVVEKGFFFPTDYLVPNSVVSSATADDIYLSVTKDQAVDRGDSWATADTTTVGQTTSTPLSTAPTGDVAFSGTIKSADAGSRGTDRSTTGTVGGGYDATGTDTAATTRGDVLRVPIHEEELTATTRPVEQGQVRVTKDVVAEERTLDVPVTEERARVTRRAVDRDASDTVGADAFREQTIDVPLRAEQVDVDKRVRVAEEVEVAKEPVQRTERVADTVRREEVHVEDQTTGAGADS